MEKKYFWRKTMKRLLVENMLLKNHTFSLWIYFIGLFTLTIAATNASLIAWQFNYIISEKDFKGKIDKNSMFNANTSTSIKFKMSIQDTVKANITAYFDKQKSWMKPNTPEKVMAHERLHFDLTEIYAREIRKRIIEIKATSFDKKTQSIQITYAYKFLVKKMAEEQALYDKESEHSVNSKKQLEWKNAITKRLSSLQQY